MSTRSTTNQTHYWFFGGMFGVTLAGMVFASIVETDTLATEIFLSQQNVSATLVPTAHAYQRLSCADITRDIYALDLMVGEGEHVVSVALGSVNTKGDWASARKRDLATAGPLNISTAEPSVITFLLEEPIAVSTLCKDTSDEIYLKVMPDISANSPITLYGSANSASYRDATYDCVYETGAPCVGGAVKDLAFALRSRVNRTPEIEPIASAKVAEGATLMIQPVAYDPDGNTLTWSSSALTNATIDAETGAFVFTPDYTQAGVYEIVLTATDDGTPISLTSEVRFTVTVVDVENPTEEQESLTGLIKSYALPNNLSKSYLAHTKNVESALAAGRYDQALQQLDLLQSAIDRDLASESISADQHISISLQITLLRGTIETEQSAL